MRCTKDALANMVAQIVLRNVSAVLVVTEITTSLWSELHRCYASLEAFRYASDSLMHRSLVALGPSAGAACTLSSKLQMPELDSGSTPTPTPTTRDETSEAQIQGLWTLVLSASTGDCPPPSTQPLVAILCTALDCMDPSSRTALFTSSDARLLQLRIALAASLTIPAGHLPKQHRPTLTRAALYLQQLGAGVAAVEMMTGYWETRINRTLRECIRTWPDGGPVLLGAAVTKMGRALRAAIADVCMVAGKGERGHVALWVQGQLDRLADVGAVVSNQCRVGCCIVVIIVIITKINNNRVHSAVPE